MFDILCWVGRRSRLVFKSIKFCTRTCCGCTNECKHHFFFFFPPPFLLLLVLLVYFTLPSNKISNALIYHGENSNVCFFCSIIRKLSQLLRMGTLILRWRQSLLKMGVLLKLRIKMLSQRALVQLLYMTNGLHLPYLVNHQNPVTRYWHVLSL